jgi:hypothetical protein
MQFFQSLTVSEIGMPESRLMMGGGFLGIVVGVAGADGMGAGPVGGLLTGG